MLNNKNLILLLTPSWVVNVIGITAGVILSGGAILLAHFTGSALRQQIFEVQTSQAAASPSNYQGVADNLANNSFLGALPLLVTWAVAGLVVYFLASAIFKAISQTFALREQMEYVHASKEGIKKDAITHLVIRLTALVLWFLFIKLTLSVIVPYALAASYATAHDLSLQGVLDVVLALAVIYGATLVHAIFLRLVVLKPRLFGNF
jgi:hypothetical protein